MAGDWVDLLGLARRAGQLLAGTETVTAAVKQGRVALLILATDLSDGTRARLIRLAQAHGVRTITALDRERLGRATGYSGRGVFAVLNKDLAKAVLSSRAAARPHGDGTEGGVCHS
ncbi:MAG: L7Ae/L30e/S12e/Gadd45 family ribosomal protein [Bacteroidota bacterium]